VLISSSSPKDFPMLHQRPSSFAGNVAAIQDQLRALESEIERIGRAAGQRTSTRMSAAGGHLGDAIASAVTEVIERFGSSRRMAGEGATRFGNEAARYGKDALHRLAGEVERRPLIILAVAIGVGVLIGAAGGFAGHRK
jgi:hypothetical protein